MLNSLLLISALACYFAATLWVGSYIQADDASNSTNNSLKRAFMVAGIALIAHLIYAAKVSLIPGGLNFSASSMAAMVSGILVLIFLLGCLAMPIRRLGILVFPFTILSLVFSAIWPIEDGGGRQLEGALGAHVLVSIVAYCLLAIAAIQALLYIYQERQIKNRLKPTMLIALPPLQTMEALLFRLVWVGFALLTLTLISGAVFSQELFGYAFAFKHHTILAIVGWCVFAILLFKRVNQGLRGTHAVAWIVGGFLLIQLGYFGTKIVSESLGVQ